MALRATGIIKRQVLHMARLVDDLLDVGRAVTGKIVLKRAPVNLAECGEVVGGDHRLRQSANHGRIDLVSEPVWVNGDAVRLEQIVGNLVSNALKFTRGDGIVSVFVGREGDDAVLRVADQGIGIPADMLPKIFDLFVQAHHTIDRSRGGLGIGLTLVRRLAELHGGSVHAAQRRRWPRLDVHRAPAHRRGADSRQRRGTAQAQRPTRRARFESRRVLLVDDNHDSREMYRAVLRAHGHEVCEAPDGEQRAGAAALATIARSTSRSSTSACPAAWTATSSRGASAAIRRRDVRLVALTGYGFPEDRAAIAPGRIRAPPRQAGGSGGVAARARRAVQRARPLGDHI